LQYSYGANTPHLHKPIISPLCRRLYSIHYLTYLSFVSPLLSISRRRFFSSLSSSFLSATLLSSFLSLLSLSSFLSPLYHFHISSLLYLTSSSFLFPLSHCLSSVLSIVFLFPLTSLVSPLSVVVFVKYPHSSNWCLLSSLVIIFPHYSLFVVFPHSSLSCRRLSSILSIRRLSYLLSCRKFPYLLCCRHLSSLHSLLMVFPLYTLSLFIFPKSSLYCQLSYIISIVFPISSLTSTFLSLLSLPSFFSPL